MTPTPSRNVPRRNQMRAEDVNVILEWFVCGSGVFDATKCS